MSQRDSGYQRKLLDQYETPCWVTEALLPHLPPLATILEPACGSGQMAHVLQTSATVIAEDIASGADFLERQDANADAIITNPPYSLAEEFIAHALRLTQPSGLVAMLLRCDFDHAKSRQHLFGQCPQFAKKLVLTGRIVWFEPSTASPSFNHAWFMWSHTHKGPPTLAYGP